MALAPSSPRLPSPPPPAEIQIGPKSPSGGATVSLEATQMEQTALDANSRRRIHPGTKAADMAAGPPLVPLNELDSAFQLQEHLAALHYHHTASGTQALTRATALHLAQPPAGIDRTLWLYELCRFLISQCNSLIVGFLFDSPPCSAGTCPEMRASEWQFLCAVHEQPKSCCAIDYCCHTLDWAANVVSDQKIFPSRFVVLSDAHSKNVGVKNLVNVFRRLHRIFAHAWFQHRSVFWTVEGQTGLYVFFKTVCDLYDLLPAENYKLPPEAEGLEGPVAEPEAERPPPTILKPPLQQRIGLVDDDGHGSGRTNTRRHIRSSPSTGSAVTTVMETDEEELDAASRMRGLHAPLFPPPRIENGEPEVAEVPVIVEQSVLDGPPPAAAPMNIEDMSQSPELSNDTQSTFTTEHQAPKPNDEVHSLKVTEPAEAGEEVDVQNAPEPLAEAPTQEAPHQDASQGEASHAEAPLSDEPIVEEVEESGESQELTVHKTEEESGSSGPDSSEKEMAVASEESKAAD